MCVGSPTAGAWSSFQRRPDDEFETDTLGVADDAKVSIEVVHRGLAGRVISVASSRRHILPTKSASDVGRAQVVVPVSDLRPHLTDHVVQIVEPLLMLFDFTQLNRKVYEGLVTDFANGRIG